MMSLGMVGALSIDQIGLALLPVATNGLSYLNVKRKERENEKDLELAERNPIDFIFNELKSQHKGLRRNTINRGRIERTLSISKVGLFGVGLNHTVVDEISADKYVYNSNILGCKEAVEKAKEKFPWFDAQKINYVFR